PSNNSTDLADIKQGVDTGLDLRYSPMGFEGGNQAGPSKGKALEKGIAFLQNVKGNDAVAGAQTEPARFEAWCPVARAYREAGHRGLVQVSACTRFVVAGFPFFADAASFFWSEEMGKKLYVGNLSYSVTDSELAKLFEPHGSVESAQVIMDRDTGRSKGFGFVEMKSDQEAQAAIAAMNGKEAGGRALVVNEARPKTEGGGRGGHGGGGRGGYGGGGGGGRRY